MAPWLIKFIGTRIIKAIKHQIDLKKIDDYVNRPNELDKEVKGIKKDIKKLQKDSHPSQEYICCRKCGCKIAKTKVKTSKKRRRKINKEK